MCLIESKMRAKKRHLHKLYKKGEPDGRDDAMSFSNQFLWRKNAAIRHIRKAFEANRASAVPLIPFPD